MNIQPEAEKLGREARKQGKPISANPFTRTSRRNGGLFKEAAWQAGWMKADNEIKKTPD